VTRWSVDPPEPASQTTETKLAEEVKLLERAQRALAQHQPAVAQSLTREADAKFGNSQLRLEREAISILAAWQAGEKTDAIARAKLFIRRFPASPHAAKLKEIAEAKP
jgi:outer membrane protein assembly factor BamD (BamD/ComL family)